MNPNHPPLLATDGFLGDTPDGKELVERVFAFGGPLFRDYMDRGYDPAVILGEVVHLLSGITSQEKIRQVAQRNRARRAQATGDATRASAIDAPAEG